MGQKLTVPDTEIFRYAKRRFDRYMENRCPLSFEDFYFRFLSDEEQKVTAEAAGLTKQRIQIIRDRYFSHLPGIGRGESSRKRREQCVSKKVLGALVPLVSDFSESPYRRIVERARGYGIVVTKEVRRFKVVPDQLIMHGWRVQPHVLARAQVVYEQSHLTYGRALLNRHTLMESRFHTYHLCAQESPERHYVFPSLVLWKHLFEDDSRTKATLYLPLSRSESVRCRIFNPLDYVDAWHLILTARES